MKNKLKLVLLLFVVLGLSESNAQIALAVAKDDSGSDVEWRISWGQGSSWECKSSAKKYLRNKGHDIVRSREGISCCGDNNIKNGYYVVIKAKYKVSGEYRISYGLGASDVSYGEAEKFAIKNLATHNWSWKKSDGFAIEKRGKF